MRIFLLLFLLAACDAFEPSAVSNIHWVDGDSGEIDGERFRLASVDAPEIRDAKCEAERALGEEAKRFARQFSRSGAIAVITDHGYDRYDRRVIELEIDGRDVIDVMTDRGLLQSWPHWDGRAQGDKPEWC